MFESTWPLSELAFKVPGASQKEPWEAPEEVNLTIYTSEGTFCRLIWLRGSGGSLGLGLVAASMLDFDAICRV